MAKQLVAVRQLPVQFDGIVANHFYFVMLPGFVALNDGEGQSPILGC
jgi:hypothetical protein